MVSPCYINKTALRKRRLYFIIIVVVVILFQAHSRIFSGALLLSWTDQGYFQHWHVTTSLCWSPFVLQSHLKFSSAQQMLLSLLQHSTLNDSVNICWIWLNLSSNYGIRSNVPTVKTKTHRQRGQKRRILQHCCLNKLEMQIKCKWVTYRKVIHTPQGKPQGAAFS